MFKRFFLTEKNILLAIAVNALIIFLLYFPQIKANDPVIFQWLEYFDLFFVILFTVEAVVKLREFGVKGYFSKGWNIFDFFIVIVSLPSLLAFLFRFHHILPFSKYCVWAEWYDSSDSCPLSLG